MKRLPILFVIALLITGCSSGRYLQVHNKIDRVYIQLEVPTPAICKAMINSAVSVEFYIWLDSKCSEIPSLENLPFAAHIRDGWGHDFYLTTYFAADCTEFVSGFVPVATGSVVVSECHYAP
jgi:hypothetical protein